VHRLETSELSMHRVPVGIGPRAVWPIAHSLASSTPKEDIGENITAKYPQYHVRFFSFPLIVKLEYLHSIL
jgi:hypothetical protein